MQRFAPLLLLLVPFLIGIETIYESYFGSFTVKRGSTTEREEVYIARACVSGSPGLKFKGFEARVSINAPEGVEVYIYDALSAGKYINSSWSPRCWFKYKVVADKNSPLGVHALEIKFPSGYVYEIDFKIIE